MHFLKSHVVNKYFYMQYMSRDFVLLLALLRRNPVLHLYVNKAGLESQNKGSLHIPIHVGCFERIVEFIWLQSSTLAMIFLSLGTL